MRREKIKNTLKNILLIGLMLLTVVLTLKTWFYDAAMLPEGLRRTIENVYSAVGLASPFSSKVEVEGSAASSYGEALRPVRCAVMVDSGRYGVEYDKNLVDILYNRISVSVGEAVGSLSEVEKVSQKEWESALSARGIYLDYLGNAPLGAIALWQGIEQNGYMDIFVRKLVLMAEEENIILYYVNIKDGAVYCAETAVPSERLMRQVGEDITTNGCLMAFEMGEEYSELPAETMFFDEETEMRAVTVSNPPVSDSAYDTLLKAFSMNPYTNYRYKQSNGSQSAIEGGRSLVLTEDGRVIYSAQDDDDSGAEIYPESTDVSSAEIIEGIRKIAAAVTGVSGGDGEIYLTGFLYEEETETYEISFGYCAAGAAVYIEDSPAAAYFRIESGRVTYSYTVLRRYTVSEERGKPLPLRWAMDIAIDQTGTARGLELCYSDRGDKVDTEWRIVE